MNRCIFIGNMTKDPELRFVPASGMAVCKFGLALNDGYGDKKTVSYINCVAFAKTAEAIANYTSKGSKVAIESRVQTGSYDKKDGSGKVYTTDFIIDKIEFLSKQETGNTPSGNSFVPSNDEDVFNPVDPGEDIPF